MNIGNHCVLFGGRLNEDMEGVLSEYAATGCDGVEVGARFIGLGRREELKFLLDKYHLKLAALHTNMLLTDIVDRPEEAKEYFMNAVRCLEPFSQKNIMFTPLPAPAGQLDMPVSAWDPRLKDPKLFVPITKALDEIAGMVAREGVTFNFHNHNYEFLNDGLIFFGILENTQAVYLGLDIGWTNVAGYDAMQLLRKYKSRVRYVHVRDYKKELILKCTKFSELHDNVFVDLGEGDTDFKELMALLEDILGKDGWATVEYETGDKNCDRYKKATDFLRSI